MLRVKCFINYFRNFGNYPFNNPSLRVRCRNRTDYVWFAGKYPSIEHTGPSAHRVGIEPTYMVLETNVLPLNYRCV